MLKGASRYLGGRPAVAAAVAAGWLVAASGPAAAHPHVWIDSTTRVLFDQGQRVVALEIEWRFDEFYSIFAIEGLDRNGDGRLEAAELRPLAELNIKSLEEYRYFTYVRIDGEDAGYGTVDTFDSRFEDGILSLRFVLPLSEPVDPRRSAVSFTSYDPSFYISIEPRGKEPVSLADGVPEGCVVELSRGGETEALNFSDADLLSTGSESIAAQFASKANLNCAAAVVSQ